MAVPLSHDVARFERWAPTYERHWLQGLIFEPVKDAVLALAAAQVPQPRAILDVGCGTGKLLRAAEQRFPTASLDGVDAAPAMVSQARLLVPAGSRISFQQATAEALPFPDGSFDLVFSTMTFHHWAEPNRGSAEVSRILSPSGRWILADFISSGVIGYFRRLLRMPHSLERRAFEAALEPIGLTVVAEGRPSGFAAGRIPVLAIGRR